MHSASVSRPRCTAAIRSSMETWPAWWGSASLRAVRGPRPSTARAAHHMASCQRLPPPPQSPEMCPTAANLAVVPSGSRPAQLMPAPHTTATPRGSSSPARSRAKVSLKTSIDRPQPCTAIALSRATCSTGRSALARQAETWSAIGPEAAGPASTRARSTSGTSPATAVAAPMRSGRKEPPRDSPRTVPSGPMIATSVLLFPASIASTAAGLCPSSSCMSGPGEVVAVVGDQPVGESVGEVDLPDERVRQEGLEHAVVAAPESSVERQVLVRRDRRDEPGAQRLKRGHWSGAYAGAVDHGGHLDHGVVREEGQGAVVAQVHHLGARPCRPTEQGCGELDGRLGV